MTEKTKQRLTVASLVILAIIAIYLLLKNNPAAAGPGTTNNVLGGNTNGGVGGNAYNLGGVSIPALAGPGAVPNVTLTGPGDGQSCCASCGCDSDNGVNGFAASVQQALNGYGQAMNSVLNQSLSSMYGQLPDFIAQYVATADPQAPSGLNG